MTRTSDRSQEALLARHFVVLADTLVADYDVHDLLDRLVHACAELLDAPSTGLLLTDARGGLQLVATTSEQLRLLELFQLQAEEGPCLDSIRGREPVTVEDLAEAEGRWPRFAPAAVAAGYRSVHAVPLRLREEVIGSLNLFRAAGPPLTPQERDIGQALADVATVGILQQRSLHRSAVLAEQLQAALTSRIVIEQAKGILAEHGGTDPESAYLALRAFARNRNRRIGELAEEIVDGRVPPAALLDPGAREP